MSEKNLSGFEIDLACANEVLGETMKYKRDEIDQAYGIVNNIIELQFIFYVETACGQSQYKNLMDILEEIKIEFQGSVLNATHGFYRNATASLRSALQLCFQGLFGYYNPSEHQEWLNGQRDTIDIKSAIDSLKSRYPRFQIYDQKYDFKNSTYSLYQELCKYVHIEGLPIFESETRKDIVPKFSAQALEKWLNYILKIWEVIATAFLVAFPFIMDTSDTVKQSLLRLLPSDESFSANMSLQGRKEIQNSL